jgi:DNA ligase-1
MLQEMLELSSAIAIAPAYSVEKMEELYMLEEAMLKSGYEGMITRKPDDAYKFGRSTLNEQTLIKIKRFIDDEATVTGFIELENNVNADTRSVLGYADRSTHQEGKHKANVLGALIVTHPKYGTFNIGSGFIFEDRCVIWDYRLKYMGKTLTFKYQKHGTKDKPRCPVFKCWKESD